MKKGFSIIEAIIYTAVLAVIFTLSINAILMMTKFVGISRITRNINSSVEVAMERMTREIRLANDVNASSVLGASPGRLVLETIDPSTGAARELEFFLSTSTLMILEGASSPMPLTSSNVEIINLVFRQINASSTSKAIKIEMEIKAREKNFQKLERFYNTAILRRSYANGN